MKTAHVLLVDDEKDFVEILAERLISRGLSVKTSFNGKEALAMAEEFVFDAIILDLAMPGMDGIETLKLMLKKNEDLQVILLTGQGTVEKSVEALKSGAIEFLEKPVKIENLIDIIFKAKSTHNKLSEQHMMDTINEIMSKRGW